MTVQFTKVVISTAPAAATVTIDLVIEARTLHVAAAIVATHAAATAVEVVAWTVGEAVEAGAVEIVVIERSVVVEIGVLVVVVVAAVAAVTAVVTATAHVVVGLLLGQRFLDRYALAVYSVELFDY